MVKIRLSRGGSKKRPFYHIVATDSRNPRDGKYIERLGYFNPRAKGSEEDINIDTERLDYWKSVGAQISDRVLNIIKLAGLSREERDSKRLNKLQKKQAKREAIKASKLAAEAPAEETPAEEEAPTEEEAPAEEETPAEEASAEEESDKKKDES